MDGLGIELGDGEASMRLLLTEAFLHEGPQGLAQGRTTYAEVGREGDLTQALAGLQITGDDGPADLIDNLFASGADLWRRTVGSHGGRLGEVSVRTQEVV